MSPLRFAAFLRPSSSPLVAAIALLALLPASTETYAALGESTPPTPAVSPLLRVREELLQMREFFGTVLPGTLEDHNLTLDIAPKLGDVRNREYLRFPVELRYGLAPRWEAFGGLTPFVPNPINSGQDHRWGPGQLRLGVRHDVDWRLGFYEKVTVGIEARTPLGEPPVTIIDHFTHVRPFLSASRPLPWPNLTFLTNASYDRTFYTPTRDDVPPGMERRHVAEVTPGLLYKPGEFGGFAEYSFRHFDEREGYRLGHALKLGAIWDPPLARTQAWGLPGKWQVELAYQVSREEGRDVDHGLSARVRWKTTLREVREMPMRRLLSRATSPGWSGSDDTRAPGP